MTKYWHGWSSPDYGLETESKGLIRKEREETEKKKESLAKAELEKIRLEKQAKVLKLLKALLKTQRAKNMFSGEWLPISGKLCLRGGELCYWYEHKYWYNDICVMPSDYDGNHNSRWITEKRWECVEPTIDIVNTYGVTTKKINLVRQELNR